MRRHLPSLLQVLGLVLVAVAGFLIHPILGLALTGVFVFGFGYLLERPIDASEPPS